MLTAIVGQTGCGDGKASVGGTVTLDGTPVEGNQELYGTVSFYRTDGGGAPAVGVIKESGQYEVVTGSQVGMAPGSYLVGISIRKLTPPQAPGGLTSARQISPVKYAKPTESGLKAEVKPGSNTFDFDLSSQGT